MERIELPIYRDEARVSRSWRLAALTGVTALVGVALLAARSPSAPARPSALESSMAPPPPEQAVVVDSANAVSKVVTLIGGAGVGFADGCGAAAKLNKPVGVTRGRDSGTFYFVDQGNHAVRKLSVVKASVPEDSYIGCVSTVAGGGSGVGAAGFRDGDSRSALFSSPANIAVGSDGTIFVADQGNHAVRGISSADFSVHTVIGNGTEGNLDGEALEVRLNSPSGLAVMETANLMVLAEGGGHTIRAVEMSTRRARTVLGHYGEAGFADGEHVSAMFNRPTSVEIAPDASNSNIEFVVSDTGNNAVRKLSVDETGNWFVQTLTGGHSAGYRDGDPVSAAYQSPTDVAFDKTGNILVSDKGNNVIRYFDRSTGTTSTLAGTQEMWVNAENDQDATPPTPGAYSDADGTGAGGSARFDAPSGLTTDASDGSIVVADLENHAIRLIVWAGTESDDQAR